MKSDMTRSTPYHSRRARSRVALASLGLAGCDPAFVNSLRRSTSKVRAVADETSSNTLPFFTRLWFAWACFFRVLFDGPFAARAWAASRAPALPAPNGPVAAVKPVEPSPVKMQGAPPALAALAATMGPQPLKALQLLAILQREGRLVDFLQQDITSFPDAEVGAAARVVHDGCRKALRAHATIEPVRAEDEGARIVLPAGFAPDEVKLTGAVGGQPPYAGVLRHRGWRATRLDLPQAMAGHDARVLAPAEVELP
jgi:hypothetical protein